NPFSHTPFGRTMAASLEMFERTTLRYGKPEFGLKQTTIGDRTVSVREEVVLSRPFCNLLQSPSAAVPAAATVAEHFIAAIG
ncbi:polyhydroxyalkanoate depolymerase, partial [Rhizobium ruizarguesonis]